MLFYRGTKNKGMMKKRRRNTMKTVSIKVTKSPMKILAFVLSLVLLVTSISGVGLALATDSTAQADGSDSTKNLSTVVNPDTKEEMFVVKSTFYDYYSDSQVEGAKGSTPGSIDDGVYGTDNRATNNSFVKFNNVLLNKYNYGNLAVSNRYPLYCGLFFGDQNSDVNGGFYYKNSDSSNMEKNFWLGANSSQKGGGKLGLHAQVNAATQGLVDSTLNANGDVTQANGAEVLPYFNKSFLTGTTHENSSLALGSVTENVSFPFRTVEKDGVKTYEFDSKYDTVHMKSNGQLEYLGYNKTYNKNVQVLDQKSDDGDGCKPGFFPYNTAADGDSTRLNYGFGVKLEIPFNMTSDGKINGQDIVFNFSGDDDVWVFIDGYLALDIGGAHGEVTGSINFNEQYATVSGVKDNSDAFAERNHWYVTDEHIKTNVKTNFSSELIKSLKNTTSSHTLTMFYMERGKIESNMKVNFNLPQPNSLTLTNQIDISNVNDALKPATKEQTQKDIFSYNVNDNDMDKKDTPLLKDAEQTTYTDQFTTGDTLDITETGLTNDGRVLKDLYTTSWDLNDEKEQISNSKNRDDYVTSDDRSKKDGTFLFQNQSDAPTTNLTVNYYNKVLVGDLVIGKDLTDDAKYENQEFNFQVTFSDVFGGSSKAEAYSGDYCVTYKDGTSEKKTAKNGNITLKAHEVATITGIPVQTKYEVKELAEASGKYVLSTVNKYNDTYTDKVAAGTISQDREKNYYTFVNARVEEPTPEPTKEPTPHPTTPAAVTAEPTKEPTPEPTAKPTVEPTMIPTVVPTVEPTVEPTDTPKPITPADVNTPEPIVDTPEPTVEPTEEPQVIDETPEVPNVPVKTTKPTKEPVIEVEPDIPSSTPKTGDHTNLFFWLMSVAVSAGAVILTGKDIFFKKKEK